MKGKSFNMNEKNLMWIVIIITALGLATKVALDNYKQSHKLAVCYIDAPQIIDKLAVIYSLNISKTNNTTNPNSTSTTSLPRSTSMPHNTNLTNILTLPRSTEEKADMLMKSLRLVLQNPKRFGCEAIFMKGAILSGGKDITQEVLKDVGANQTSP